PLCCHRVGESRRTLFTRTSFLLRRDRPPIVLFFFFNAPATTDIYTLSLHDALPICSTRSGVRPRAKRKASWGSQARTARYPSWRDRKSTRLNSSHVATSYAVFCLKKKIMRSHLHS